MPTDRLQHDSRTLERGGDDPLDALRVDVAVTEHQAREHYGVRARDVRQAGGFVARRMVKERIWSKKATWVGFVTLDRDVSRYEGHRLRHLAGTAAIRQLLEAPVSAWRSTAAAEAATLVPDALWDSPIGVTAIEYDAGSYKRATVLEKGTVFSEHPGGQVWGVVSEKRAEHVRALLSSVATNRVIVLYAPWT